jgi:hypothetical protein
MREGFRKYRIGDSSKVRNMFVKQDTLRGRAFRCVDVPILARSIDELDAGGGDQGQRHCSWRHASGFRFQALADSLDRGRL